MKPGNSVSPWAARLGWIALGLGILWLWFHFVLAAGGSDSSGYLNSARLFAGGRLETTQRLPSELGPDVPRIQFMPLGFWPSLRSAGQVVPTYPSGLPLQFAAASMLFGWNLGPSLVLILLAGAAPLLCALCAREMGLSLWHGVAAGAILALSPVFVFFSQQPLSDVPATTWCLAAVWTALRAKRLQDGKWAVASGLCLAVAVLVRPTNVLLLPCLVLLLGHWRLLIAAGVGGVPGLLWQGYYNHVLFGHALRTGYMEIGSSFGAEWVSPTLALYREWLPRMLPAIVFVLPVLAIWAGRAQLRVWTALALWWIAFAGFYTFYAVTHQVWWCLRFIMPAFPAVLLAAMMGIEQMVQWIRPKAPERIRAFAAVALVVWASLSVHFWAPRLGMMFVGLHSRPYRDSGVWVRDHLPANAIVSSMATSGALYYYTSLATLRYDQITPEIYSRHAPLLRAAGHPIYALLVESEREQAQTAHGSDEWTKVQDFQGISLWRLTAAK